MTKTVLFASMSLDGFSTGPNDDLTVLHGWAFGDDSMAMAPEVSAEFSDSGAIVFGARTLREGDRAWGNEEVFSAPVFVVVREARASLRRNGTLFTFVHDGVERALRLAQEAAGDKHVTIMGSANVAQQLLNLGLVDELELHVVSVLLGGGIRLFDHLETGTVRLERTRVIESKGITHLRYSVVR